MKNSKLCATLLVCLMAGTAAAAQTNESERHDWAKHERYAQANSELTTKPDVVFMGNSITDFWYQFRPEFFDKHNFAGRGISGQVTSQMLCRFMADVVDLHPRAVVICAGINDLAGNNGPIDIPYIVDNVASMVDLARANGIIPIVGATLPTNYAPWKPELQGLGQLVVGYNDALKQMCADRSVTMVDYYTPLVDSEGGIIAEYSDDRLHPNLAGYTAVMEPAVLAVINQVLASEAPTPVAVTPWPEDKPNDN